METTAVAPLLQRAVYIVCDGQPRLIDALPVGLPRLIDRLIGAVQRRHDELLPRALNTLRALLSHVNYKSNRVWASLIRLGWMLVGKADTSKDHGYKKAQRGVDDLVKAGLVVKLESQEDILRGPGEHDYLAAGGEKRGDGPVNHYDLSPLLAYVDAADIAEWDMFYGEGRVLAAIYPPPPPSRDVDALMPDPWTETPVTAAPNTQTAPVSTPDIADPDPFAPDFAGSLTDLSPAPGSIADSIRASLSLSVIASEKTSHLPCDVKAEAHINETRQVGGAEQTAVLPRIFNGTNLSDRTNQCPLTREAGRREPKVVGLQLDGERLTLLQLLTRNRDNGGRQMDLPGAQALMADYAEEYLRDLVEYGFWMEAKDGTLRGGGWMLATARGMKGDWPFDFKQYLVAKRRDEDRAKRQAVQEAKLRAQVPAGVAAELVDVWPRLLKVLKEDYGVRQLFLDMHVAKLRRVDAVGDTVVMEAANQFSYKQLSLTCTDVFSRALSGLLGRPLVTQFVPLRGDAG